MDNIIRLIDEEIAKLQGVRRLIAGNVGAKATVANVARRRGRRKGTMSADARARIAEAQRKRWAKQKRQSA